MPMTPIDGGFGDSPWRKRDACRDPCTIASGIETPIVNVPHALCCSAFDDREAQAGERDHDDEEDGDRGGDAGDRADLGARDVGERTAAAPHRGPQDDVVVDRAREADAGDEPDEAGGIAELSRKHRADQRAGAGDRGEVMTEQNEAMGRVKVVDRRSARAPA